MRNLFRLFSVFLLVGTIALAYGPVAEGGTLTMAGDTAGVSADIGTVPNGHDHGPGDSGEAHHCMAASCTSVFMIAGDRTALHRSRIPSEFLTPPEDSDLGSAYLDSDPPVPRFSA